MPKTTLTSSDGALIINNKGAEPKSLEVSTYIHKKRNALFSIVRNHAITILGLCYNTP